MKNIQEKQNITLRECKRILQDFMDNYAEEMPITVEIHHQTGNQIFDVVPRKLRHKTKPMNLQIHEVSVDDLEEVTESGFYIASNSFHMGGIVSDNYYGLYIDPDNERDLRYFDQESKCMDWLKKKIKTINS